MEAKGYVRTPDDGEVLPWGPAQQLIVKVSSETAGGHFDLMYNRNPEGDKIGMHVHQKQNEVFWVLEGEYTVRCGDDTFLATPGSMVFVPMGVPHGFSSEQPSAKLTMSSPGGLDGFFRDMSAAIMSGQMNKEEMNKIAAAHDMISLE